MRIWDLNPGYLDRQSLLAEHRELHWIVSSIQGGKRSRSMRPEVLRWKDFGWGLRQRHDSLVAEMRLRGYTHVTPVLTRRRPGEWPGTFIDSPAAQFDILQTRHPDKQQGRIPLPSNVQQLWAQHKYSVMARNPALYRELGPKVSRMRARNDLNELSGMLVEELKKPPAAGHLRNALQHMWGHVGSHSECRSRASGKTLSALLRDIQVLAMDCREKYLLQSTALSELVPWAEILDRRGRKTA